MEFSILKSSLSPLIDLSRITERRIEVPRSLVDTFIALADRNTESNIETLGFLAGIIEDSVIKVTGLVLPK